MNKLTRCAKTQFDELKLAYVRALYATYEREICARDAGRLDLARHLYDNRESFLSLFLELRRAENVFARSKRPKEEILGVLSNVAQTLQDAIETLETPELERQGSDQIVQLLTNLSDRLR